MAMVMNRETPTAGAAHAGTGAWIMRLCWAGGGLWGWLRLLAHGRCAIDRPYWLLAIAITLLSLYHTLLHLLQLVLYGRRITQTQIVNAPFFVIGHWRSGTTFLHDLLSLDERHAYPTTYQCVAPNHFLVTEFLGLRGPKPRLPSRRLMDNMAFGWERPSEDEFALCLMGQPSPYRAIAFPNQPLSSQCLDLERISRRELGRWKSSFVRFLKQITYLHPKRIVLKSPTHTCRIKVLLELFPDARFVHIVRNPYEVFISTMHLWKSVYQACALQRPEFDRLKDYIFDTYIYIDNTLDQTRSLVARNRFCEIRYEDLVRDPVEQLRAIYERLEMGEFEKVLPALERHLAGVAAYQTNRYECSPQLHAEITRRWGRILRKYGYL